VTNSAETVFIQGPSAATSMAYRRYFGTSELPTRGPVTTAEGMAVIVATAPQLTMPVLDSEVLTVHWHDEPSYRAAVEQFRQDLLQRYSSMIEQLRGAGTLTADDATSLATPNLKIVIDDQRTAKLPR
jgi:hypothetical protein